MSCLDRKHCCHRGVALSVFAVILAVAGSFHFYFLVWGDASVGAASAGLRENRSVGDGSAVSKQVEGKNGSGYRESQPRTSKHGDNVDIGIRNRTRSSIEVISLEKEQQSGDRLGKEQSRPLRPDPASQQNQTRSSRTVPGSVSIPHFEELQQKGLILSLKQQKSYFERKEHVLSWLTNHKDAGKRRMLDFVGVSAASCFAVILNERYAYRHIYKTGGTTVERQAGRKQVSASEYGNRLLMATVRDPIDHFLSGWAECGVRGKIRQENNTDAEYDARVFAWLNAVRNHQYSWYKNGRKRLRCENHSFPQANYLLRLKQDLRNALSFIPKWIL